MTRFRKLLFGAAILGGLTIVANADPLVTFESLHFDQGDKVAKPWADLCGRVDLQGRQLEETSSPVGLPDPDCPYGPFVLFSFNVNDKSAPIVTEVRCTIFYDAARRVSSSRVAITHIPAHAFWSGGVVAFPRRTSTPVREYSCTIESVTPQ
jgi:hypothetical protein